MVRPAETGNFLKRIGFYGIAAATGIFLLLPISARAAASLYFSPAARSIAVGQTMAVTVGVSSADQAMNAASADISFPTNRLQVLSISESNSIISLWVRNPSFANSGATGNIHFEGIVLNPGFTGAAGALVRVTFQAIGAGDAPVTFSEGSVLANDGNGTSILDSLGTADFTVVPGSAGENPGLPSAPIITSITHPNEQAWYNTTTLELAWQLPSDVTAVSYALASSTQYVLPSRSEGLLSSTTYDLAGYADGSLYFFAKFRNQNGWGPIAIRTVNMDFSSPEPFPITEMSGVGTGLSQPVFTWHAADMASGIRNYMVQIGSGPWIDASTLAIPSTTDEYRLPPQAPGSNILLAVEAFDKAGNMALATTTFSVSTPSLPVSIYCSFTFNISDLKACGWFGEVLAFFIEWGALLLLIFIIAALVVFTMYTIMHRLQIWHLSSNRTLLTMREELRTDLRRIEKEMESSGEKVNQERLHQEIEHIENDIKNDIKRLDNND